MQTAKRTARVSSTPGYHGEHDNSINRDTCQTNARGLNLLSVLKIMISNCHMDIDIGVHIVLILGQLHDYKRNA